MSSISVVVACDSCCLSVQIPPNSWYSNCRGCGKLAVEPIEFGFQYVITTCKVSYLYRHSEAVQEFTCNCCRRIHVITNETVFLHGQPFKKAEIKLTAEQLREKELRVKLEQMKLEKEASEKEVQMLMKEVEAMILEVEGVECDKCHQKKIFEGFESYCECSAMLLKKLDKGFKYVLNNCDAKIYRLKADSHWFICNCCGRERVIGTVVLEKICGQEVYSSEMSDSMIRNLNAALEKEKKAVEEEQIKTKCVEETLGLQIADLKREIEFLRNVESRTAQMTDATVAKLCETMIAPLVSQLQKEQKWTVDQEELTQLKYRAKEAEASYLEQKSELTNEIARYESELVELRADANSLSESNADLWSKLAETEARCTDLENQNEMMNTVQNNLMEINMMAIRKINEMADSSFGPEFKKNEGGMQAIVDMQTARM